MLAAGWATYWCGSAYGLWISSLVPNIEVAMTLMPIIFIPLMIFGGMYVNQNSIEWYYQPFAYLSFFKYGFEAVAQNEYEDQDFVCNGQPCYPLKIHDFPEDYETALYMLIGLGFVIRIIALIQL